MARAPAAAEIEELPEADRLDGFPHPRFTERLYGHAAIETELAQTFASGRMHHGWLLTGPEGVGKATLAYRLARFLIAAASERDMFGASLDIGAGTTAARQVRSLSHPDLLVIRRPYDVKAKRLRTEITVDEVRRLKGFLQLRGTDGGWRAVIVDPADDLNSSAANALLKSLEEPPVRTIFLLISAAPNRLLPTIRSRCRTINCEPLNGEMLKKAVTQAMAASGDSVSSSVPAGQQWETLETLAQGSVRRALGLLGAKGFESYDRIIALVTGLPAVDWPAVHNLGDELGSTAAEAKFQLFFDLLLGLLARMVRAAAAKDTQSPEGQWAARLISEPRLAAWAQVWETVVAEKADADALNLDRKSLILNTFSRLERAARG
jgi:DNA polymerase III subunit delta'